jgi:hypothetical protein
MSEPAISTLLGPIQLALHHDRVRGWLLYDHRGRSVVAARLLGSLDEGGGRASVALPTEHRLFFWIPAEGLPVVVAHEDDAVVLPELPGDRVVYRTPLELRAALEKQLPRAGTVLVEQGPFAQIADLALVDEATLSLLRGRDAVVRSSIALANRFAGPLASEERSEVVELAARLERVHAALAVEVTARPPSSWEALWAWAEAAAAAEGLALHDECGLALEEGTRGARAVARRGGPLEPGARARLDLWASRRGGSRAVLVPSTQELTVGASPELEALSSALEACEAELLRAVDERARRGRVLGSEVAELAHDAVRRRGLEPASRCVGWPLGPVPRGSHACTFDAEGFADPRELVPGTCWALCLGARSAALTARRTTLVERTDRALAVIARPARPILALLAL